MLLKFETKVRFSSSYNQSNRVKGISFHPTRPWVISSLHNGSLQLWDYKMGTLVDKFEEHQGPVRGVAFHSTQPLFVSGGDDYKIKVWNWKQRKCLFTLNGHLDYVRTVFFHHEYPWIISASDDQTIRIWNWQSRTCISILTGHSHYVMCAQFHPKDDLIVSASLDQTIRIWDISGLIKKHTTAQMPSVDHSSLPGKIGAGQAELFGTTDATVRFVLEGHDRGVNWASFHPSLPLIISGADDRQVKLWRMNETKAWEVDTCRGHYNNVSSAIFHPHAELILSNSEDKTIRVWDMTKRTAIHTFRREHDRFWVLAAHPNLNLFASGHDNGLVVFKLERERPPAAIFQDQLYYLSDKFIRLHDFKTSSDIAVAMVKKSTLPGLNTQPKSLSYNPAEHAILLFNPTEGAGYELINLPKTMTGDAYDSSSDAKRGPGQSAVFVARNRFAVLSKANGLVYIKDLQNTVTKQFPAPPGTCNLFYAGMKNILLVTPQSAILFDTELKANVAEINVPGIRYAVWSNDLSTLALMSKHAVVIANKRLEKLSQANEIIKIKGGAWDDLGVFVYSTLNHIKYILPQGDVGLIKTLEHSLYIMRIKDTTIYCLDRDAKVVSVKFDPTEYKFKLALVRKEYDQVLHIIKTSNLVGQSVIAFLQKKGFSEIALHFVKDPKTRFELALECGNLDIAVETAKVIDKPEVWSNLGVASLKQGNHQVLEMVYQKLKQFDKLSLLYFFIGNSEKLRKMSRIAEMRNDTSSHYQNALLLGDIDEQVKILNDIGQVQLAYLTAKTHGLDDIAHSILHASGVTIEPPTLKDAKLLKPPTVILKLSEANWPLVSSASKPSMINEFKVSSVKEEKNENAQVEQGAWGDDIEIEKDDILDDEAGWGLDEELTLHPQSTTNEPNPTKHTGFIMPTRGISIQEQWAQSRNFVDQIAAGNFEAAIKMLNEKYGIVKFSLLKPLFIQLFNSTVVYQTTIHPLPSLAIGVTRNGDSNSLPFICYNLIDATEKMDEAYALTTAGRFTDTVILLKSLLRSLLFVVSSGSNDDLKITSLISSCREYINGLAMEMGRRELTGDAHSKRVVELAAYFTHCRLLPEHMILSLRSAMRLAYNLKNFGTASVLATRLLELKPEANIADQVKTVLVRCERTPTNAIQLDYEPQTEFDICALSFTPIGKGSVHFKCGFCLSKFKPEFKDQICPTCEVTKIGVKK